MAKFFVSYSRSDKDKVRKIVDQLQGDGHDVWWDDDIPSMAHWWEIILDKIKWCEVFIFILSKASNNSDYCIAEYNYALALNRPILQLKLDDTPEIARHLQSLSYSTDTATMLSRINDAYKKIDWDKHENNTDVERPNPPPDNGQIKYFQEAGQLAEKGNFREARLSLNRQMGNVDNEWRAIYSEWIEKLTSYEKIIALVKHKSTFKRARMTWKAHIAVHGTDFDPYDIAGKLGGLDTESTQQPDNNQNELKPQKARVLSYLSSLIMIAIIIGIVYLLITSITPSVEFWTVQDDATYNVETGTCDLNLHWDIQNTTITGRLCVGNSSVHNCDYNDGNPITFSETGEIPITYGSGFGDPLHYIEIEGYERILENEVCIAPSVSADETTIAEVSEDATESVVMQVTDDPIPTSTHTSTSIATITLTPTLDNDDRANVDAYVTQLWLQETATVQSQIEMATAIVVVESTEDISTPPVDTTITPTERYIPETNVPIDPTDLYQTAIATLNNTPQPTIDVSDSTELSPVPTWEVISPIERGETNQNTDLYQAPSLTSEVIHLLQNGTVGTVSHLFSDMYYVTIDAGQNSLGGWIRREHFTLWTNLTETPIAQTNEVEQTLTMEAGQTLTATHLLAIAIETLNSELTANATASGTTMPIPTRTPFATNTLTPTSTITLTPSPTNTLTPTDTPTSTFTPTPSMCRVTPRGEFNVNVRHEPTINSGILRILQVGNSESAQAKTTVSTSIWYQLSNGWVRSDTVREQGNCADLGDVEVSTPTPYDTEISDTTGVCRLTVTASQGVNVRNYPNYGDIVGGVGQNAERNVSRQMINTPSGAWYRVSNGWVIGGGVSLAGDCSTLPTDRYQPPETPPPTNIPTNTGGTSQPSTACTNYGVTSPSGGSFVYTFDAYVCAPVGTTPTLILTVNGQNFYWELYPQDQENGLWWRPGVTLGEAPESSCGDSFLLSVDVVAVGITPTVSKQACP